MEEENKMVLKKLVIDSSKSIQRTKILSNSIHHFESVIAKRMFYVIDSLLKKGHSGQFDFIGDIWIKIPTNLLSSDKHYKYYDNATNDLMSAKFEFLDIKNERFSKVIPFPSVQYQKGWGYIKVKINQDALPMLCDVLSQGYFEYNLEDALKLKSSYSQRLYELFCERVTYGRWDGVTIDYLRKVLGIELNVYEEKKQFLRHVIYKSISEINKLTQIKIEYSYMNNMSRNIMGFDFKIERQLSSKTKNSIEKLNKYVDELLLLSSYDQAKLLLDIKEKYCWSETLYNKIVLNNDCLNKVIEVDFKIKSGILKPKSNSNYMGSIVKQYILTE